MKMFENIHTVKILSVDETDTDEYDVEYDIDHGNCTADPEECLISQTINDLGWQAAIFGVFSKDQPQVGTFKVRGWESKYDVPGYPIEWDAGIELVE